MAVSGGLPEADVVRRRRPALHAGLADTPEPARNIPVFWWLRWELGGLLPPANEDLLPKSDIIPGLPRPLKDNERHLVFVVFVVQVKSIWSSSHPGPVAEPERPAARLGRSDRVAEADACGLEMLQDHGRSVGFEVASHLYGLNLEQSLFNMSFAQDQDHRGDRTRSNLPFNWFSMVFMWLSS